MTEFSDATRSSNLYEPSSSSPHYNPVGIYIDIASAIIQLNGAPTIIERSAIETVEQKFERLKAAWLKGVATTSSLDRILQHPAYQDIIIMGPEVTPFILKDLEASPKPWFYALWKIEGVDPIPASAAGNLRRMTRAWLKWGGDAGRM